MILPILNTRLTGKDGTVYEIGKYITVPVHSVRNRKGEWLSTDQYYIRGFQLGGAGLDYAWIAIQGRFKGDTTETGLCGPKPENLNEKIKILKIHAEWMRDCAGRGRKNRYVQGSDGYIWLPDFMIFDEPYQILRWACDDKYTHYKELHDGPPDPPCFPDWKAEENGFEVVEGLTRR